MPLRKASIYTGSRDTEHCPSELAEAVAVDADVGSVVFVGDCPTGIDMHVRMLCTRYGIRPRVFCADWDALGRGAGSRRNSDMIAAASATDLDVVCRSFHGPESNDCVTRAEAAGIRVVDYSAVL